MSRPPGMIAQTVGRVGSIRRLATHSHRFPGPQASQRLFDAGQERAQVVNVVAGRQHDNNADSETRKILLILDALIDRQESVELLVGELEQCPVLDAGPAHVLDRLDFMAEQLAFEPFRDAFIEKEAHERRVASCVEVRPAPGSFRR